MQLNDIPLWMRLWMIMPTALQPRFVRIAYTRMFFRWLDSGHYTDFNWIGGASYVCPEFRYKAIKRFVGAYVLRKNHNSKAK